MKSLLTKIKENKDIIPILVMLFMLFGAIQSCHEPNRYKELCRDECLDECFDSISCYEDCHYDCMSRKPKQPDSAIPFLADE